MRRRDRALIVEGRGDLRSHYLVEAPVFHALRQVLAEILGRHPRRSRALSLGNERDLHRARTRSQPRPSRIAVVEPRRHHRDVRMHVAELVAARRHLPHERVRDVATQLVLQVQVQPAPPERYLVVVAAQVAAVLDGERDEMDDGRLVLVARPPAAHAVEVTAERVGEAPRQSLAAALAAVRAEPPLPAAEQRGLAATGAPALHRLAVAAAPLDLAPQWSGQRSGPRGRVPGLRAGARDAGEATGARPPVVDILLLQSDSQSFPVLRQKLRLRTS